MKKKQNNLTFNGCLYHFWYDMAKLYIQFFRPKCPKDLYHQAISTVCSFIKELIAMNIRLWAVAYGSLKTKEQSSWVIPKVAMVACGNGCLQELFITKFKSQFNWGYTKVVANKAGRLQEWSQGEIWLYHSIPDNHKSHVPSSFPYSHHYPELWSIGRSSRDKGAVGGGFSKTFFLALWASFWSKNKGGPWPLPWIHHWVLHL